MSELPVIKYLNVFKNTLCGLCSCLLIIIPKWTDISGEINLSTFVTFPFRILIIIHVVTVFFMFFSTVYLLSWL